MSDDALIRALREMAARECWMTPESTVEGQAADEIERLRARIEELEQQVKLAEYHQGQAEASASILQAEIDAMNDVDAIFIPYERIDKMWEYIEKLKIAGDDRCSSLAIVIKEVLALADIVECDHLKASQINGELVEPCPDCNGRGWRMKDE